MADKWDDIHGPHGPAAAGFSKGSPRHDTPFVRRPTCSEHCSGNHSRDSVLACPHCRAVAYEVWVHEWVFTPGHYFNEVRPTSRDLPPIVPGETPMCRDCGTPLVRR